MKRAVQRGGVTAPPDQQHHTGPFPTGGNVTGSRTYRDLRSFSCPESAFLRRRPGLAGSLPEPYRPLSRISSQPRDGIVHEYNAEARRFELLSSAYSLPAQRGGTDISHSDHLGDSHPPLGSTNSRSSDRIIDVYWGQTPLPESPSLALGGVPRSPRPIVASAASPLSPRHRGPSLRSRFVDDTDRFLPSPGRNSPRNSDIPGAPLRPNFQARSLPEAVDPQVNYSAIEHHQPLISRRPDASSSGGSANHNRRATPRSPFQADVLESRKHNVTAPESSSLYQEPTHVHSLISPPLAPLPGATTSSKSPTWSASMRTTRITLPDEPQEVPGRVEYYDYLCDFRPEPYRPLSRTNSQLGDGDLDEYIGEATLSESPSPAPSTVRRHPKPIDALAESPFPFQQREPSRQPYVHDDTDRFLPARNSRRNSGIPGTLLRPDLQSRGPPELVFPRVNYSATEHHQPLTGRGPNTPASAGSAHQYIRRAAPDELPLPTVSEVLESPKHNVALSESPSLHQRPTYAPYLSSSPSNPLPGSTSSSQSSTWLASIRTTRATLLDQPQEVPGRVDYELPNSGDESRGMLALPDEQRHAGPAATPCSVAESPNLFVTFAESEPQGGSTNGIMWEILR